MTKKEKKIYGKHCIQSLADVENDESSSESEHCDDDEVDDETKHSLGDFADDEAESSESDDEVDAGIDSGDKQLDNDRDDSEGSWGLNLSQYIMKKRSQEQRDNDDKGSDSSDDEVFDTVETSGKEETKMLEKSFDIRTDIDDTERREFEYESKRMKE